MNINTIIYPAIDLKDGKCVRLYKGDMNQATIFNEDPVSQAISFEESGYKYLHIVDLDGAFAGKSINKKYVKEILKNISIPIQLGGGIRNLKQIEEWIDLGISRIIIGTAALTNPELIIESAKKFPDKIAVGIDARNGFVATDGWSKDSKISVIDLAKKFEDAGICRIIYTDINRDGTLLGFDVDGTKNLAQNVNIPIIASGGVKSIDDIRKVEELRKFGVEGIIVGKAIYEGILNYE